MPTPPKRIAKRLADMRADPGNVRTPWPADPRVNLQEAGGGKAEAYQVRQLLAAVERLELMSRGPDDDG